MAILNANYIAQAARRRIFPVLYKGHGGLVAHECILDLRQFKSVTVEDVAKRLMDYGFHAPTISWPVPGTMMVEPTESESKEELDRFCEAMIGIHAEIKAIESGKADRQNNLLKNAPHTADMLAADKWDRPYSREQAGYPGEVAARTQILARRRPHRQRVSATATWSAPARGWKRIRSAVAAMSWPLNPSNTASHRRDFSARRASAS